MKNLIVKAITVLIFAFLLTFTLNTNKESGQELNISFDVASAQAEITCYSTAKRNLNYAYVDCASCNRLTGWRATGGQSTCDPNLQEN